MEALALALVLLPGGRLELAGAPPPFASPGPWPVGVRRITLTDRSREDAYLAGHRVLVTEVWYPAVDEVKGQEPVEFLDFFAPHPEAGEAFVRHFKGEPADANARFRSVAVRDARPRTGRFPLLVFSHGNGGVRHQNLSQLEHLASHGYVVASPDHPGNAGVTIIGEKVVQIHSRTPS
ncbi:MAG TPA: hypothetical protein VMT52_11535 [Planctomycetota bacterium]|nr:hypothetical protein [Planctomycetota bacterium]